MTRMLMLATFRLPQPLQLLAQTQTDLCKAQCKGQSKAPQWLAGRGAGTGRNRSGYGAGICQCAKVLVRPLSELREALAR
jgi:hypothetical protein